MKKVLALIFACLMCLSFMAACGDDDTKKAAENKNTATTAAVQNQVVDVTNTTAEVVATDAPEATVGEEVVVDNDIVKIVITKFEMDDIWGNTLKVSVENKTADKDINVSTDYVTVNGVETTAILYTDVAAGKVANDEISFYDDLEAVGAFSDIEIAISVREQEDYLSDPLCEAVYNYYPYGEEKATKYTYTPADSDEVLVDNGEVLFVVTGYEYDDLWGYTVNFYVENRTDKNLMFTADDVSVNDIMLDPYYVQSVQGGKVAFGKMDWSETDFEDNKIEDVESIEFSLRAYDMDDFLADDTVNQKVTLNP